MRCFGLAMLALALALVLAGLAGIIQSDQTMAAPGQQRERYIVELNVPGSHARQAAQGLGAQGGFQPDHVFENVMQGFSAELNPAQVRALQRNPNVSSITPDFEIKLFQQQIPVGIKRIGALSNDTANINGIDQRVDVDIAILDTGIRTTHSDLNVVGGYNCMSTNTSAYNDGHGHGTHVAGTAAAVDNNIGVVGVAPGARLWAVKVFGDNGSGSFSTLICGMDWTAANSSTIDVANFSGGATLRVGANDPLHGPVKNLVENYGVPLVVAAGNQNVRADSFQCSPFAMCKVIPAAYHETLTVGAIIDTDGQPGALGPATSHGADDAKASFSNFGPAVDVFAPGSMILSTTRTSNTSTGTMSGTSMASPHVAGAVGLYLAENPVATPDEVRQAIVATGVESGAWDGFGQPLVYVGSAVPAEPVSDVAVTAVTAPNQMFSDESADVTVFVENVGNQSMENVEVTLEINQAEFGSSQTVSLGAGQSQNVVFSSWAPSETGTFTLVGTVQHEDDENSDNNIAQATVEVVDRVHDLSVTSVSALSSVTQGLAATVDVVVKNESTQTESITVSLSSDPTNAAADPSDQHVSVPANESRTLTFKWQTSETTALGEYQLIVTASIVGQFAQAVGNTQISVIEQPDLDRMYIGNLTAFSSGSTLVGLVTVLNDSGFPVSGATVQVSITGPQSLTANATTNSNGVATFGMRGAPSGTYTVAVENITHVEYQYDPSLNSMTSTQYLH